MGGIMAKRLLIICAAFTFFLASSVQAAPIGFQLTVLDDPNTPTFQLTNIGDVNIDVFDMTIGNTAYNFDFVRDVVPSGISYTRIAPDTVDNGVRSDYQQFQFSNFTPGLTFQWETNLDPDNNNVVVDYRTIFFNNGAAPNSIATVWFEGGAELSATFPDADQATSYSIGAEGVSEVPVPAAVWLLGSGLLGLLGLRRKTR